MTVSIESYIDGLGICEKNKSDSNILQMIKNATVRVVIPTDRYDEKSGCRNGGRDSLSPWIIYRTSIMIMIFNSRK